MGKEDATAAGIADRVSETDHALAELERVISALGDAVTELHLRLASVMRPSEPATAAAMVGELEPERTLSAPLAIGIRGMSEFVRRERARLVDALDRLET